MNGRSFLVATDLDRTMIYSRSAMDEEQFATVDTVCVEIYDGAPLSYMTATAHRLLAELAERAPVIPTTTRTPEQYQRIALPGGPYPYAVTSNGGAILVDGQRDAGWRRRIDETVAASGPPVTAVVDEVHARIDESWVHNLRVADDLFCYLVVDLAAQPRDFVAEWRQWCEPRGWNVSQQGRKIYTMPNAVTKSTAMQEVRRRLVDDGTLATDSGVLAAGDGWLDADLLDAADAGIRPRHGELHTLSWLRPHVTVTADRGAVAGQQILEWLHSHVTTVASASQRVH